jgi:F-box-like
MANFTSIPNDILRLILKEASPTVTCIQTNKLVCKRWYGMYHDLRLWRDLYQRDFQKENDCPMSDLVNYQLMYRLSWLNSNRDTRNYISISDLNPDQLMYGPIIQNWDGKININIGYVESQTHNIITSILTKVSGFSLKISGFGNTTVCSEIQGLNNNSFKIAIMNIVNYINYNFNKIVNGTFFYNGNQYSSIGDVKYLIPKPVQNTINGPKKGVIFENNYNFNISDLSAWDYNTNVKEYCVRCRTWHEYKTGSMALRDLCARYKEPKMSSKPKVVNESVLDLKYNNCTVVFSLNGFMYDPKTNKININWRPKQLLLNN